jgi:poly(beta-D-mannuronate) lyase
MSVKLAAALSLGFLLVMHASAARADLVPPWDISIGKVAPLGQQKPCAKVLAPVITLATETIYDTEDSARTEIDPESQKKYLNEIAPVRAYLRDVVKLANSFALSHGENRVAGQCAARAILAWAKAGALGEAKTQIAMFNRATFLAGIASAYIQIRQSPELKPDERTLIESWLRGLSDETREFYTKKRESKTVEPNNIQYWGSLGVAMAAIATGDQDSLAWAVEAVRLGACEATPEGALPRELARKQRARHYHLFALAPLVMLAEIAERNSLLGYEACGGALHRIVAFALHAIDDPSEIEELAGTKQLAMEPLKSDTGLAWLEPYAKRFPDKSWRLSALRPLSNSYLGGNLTALYAGR